MTAAARRQGRRKRTYFLMNETQKKTGIRGCPSGVRCSRTRSYMWYAVSPCEVMSRPSRSSSSGTRSPTSRSAILYET